MELHVKTQAWLDVSQIRKEHKESFDKTLLVPYADWLAAQGSLSEALEVNREAGRTDRNTKLLSFLIQDAIVQEDYMKLSTLYWILSEELLKDDSHHGDTKDVRLTSPSHLNTVLSKTDVLYQKIDKSNSFVSNIVREKKRLSMFFLVYGQIIDYSEGVFSSSVPQATILQACVFMLHSIDSSHVPDGISMARLLLIFSDTAKRLGAFLSTRVAYDWISDHYSADIPEHQVEKLSYDMMSIEVSRAEEYRSYRRF